MSSGLTRPVLLRLVLGYALRGARPRLHAAPSLTLCRLVIKNTRRKADTDEKSDECVTN